ncbi:hypothetical protein NDU88_006515, partial [Pleurodeles waltl]
HHARVSCTRSHTASRAGHNCKTHAHRVPGRNLCCASPLPGTHHPRAPCTRTHTGWAPLQNPCPPGARAQSVLCQCLSRADTTPGSRAHDHTLLHGLGATAKPMPTGCQGAICAVPVPFQGRHHARVSCTRSHTASRAGHHCKTHAHRVPARNLPCARKGSRADDTLGTGAHITHRFTGWNHCKAHTHRVPGRYLQIAREGCPSRADTTPGPRAQDHTTLHGLGATAKPMPNGCQRAICHVLVKNDIPGHTPGPRAHDHTPLHGLGPAAKSMSTGCQGTIYLVLVKDALSGQTPHQGPVHEITRCFTHRRADQPCKTCTGWAQSAVL